MALPRGRGAEGAGLAALLLDRPRATVSGYGYSVLARTPEVLAGLISSN